MPRSMVLGLLVGALCLGIASHASAGLFAYYPFNGDANDASGVNIDLNLVGDAGYGTSVAPGLGSSLSLDGNGDGAIGSGFVKATAGGSFSVVAWVYANNLDAEWDTIVKNWGTTTGGQFHFGLGNNFANTLQEYLNGPAGVTDDVDLPTNEWVHTAAVFDAVAGKHRLYINGAEAASVDTTTPLGLGAATGLGVGIKPNDDGSAVSSEGAFPSPGPWNGRIDEVGLYDEALQPEDILQIYHNGLNGIQLDGTSVPEPATLCGALLAAIGMATLLRKRLES
jgi:Concanavalin A-like lectin/glucanases superfamily